MTATASIPSHNYHDLLWSWMHLVVLGHRGEGEAAMRTPNFTSTIDRGHLKQPPMPFLPDNCEAGGLHRYCSRTRRSVHSIGWVHRTRYCLELVRIGRRTRNSEPSFSQATFLCVLNGLSSSSNLFKSLLTLKAKMIAIARQLNAMPVRTPNAKATGLLIFLSNLLLGFASQKTQQLNSS